jgi:hypothetical protein
MKRAVHAMNIIIFILIIAGSGAVNFILQDDPDTPAGEARAVLPAPTKANIRSGEFAERFDQFYSSNFMFREKLVSLRFRIEDLYGVSGDNQAELVTVKRGDRFAVQDLPPLEAAGKDDPALPEKPEEGISGTVPVPRKPEPAPPGPDQEADAPDNRVINEILLLEDRGMEVLQYNTEAASYYAASVNLLVSVLPEEVPVYLMVLPSRLAFADENYRTLGADQEEGINVMYANIDRGVTTIDPFPTLSGHIDEYVYFRTDHHWTALGAYYLYRDFVLKAGMDPVPLDRYETAEVSGFTGSMYINTWSKKLARNPDTIILYKPFTAHTYKVLSRGEMIEKPILDMSYKSDQNKYQIFVSSDRRLGVITTESDSDRKLLLLKDSYGNAFIPFLLPHYREIHVIDPRYYEESVIKYFREHEFDEVLLINYFALIGNVKGYARNLRNRIIDTESD